MYHLVEKNHRLLSLQSKQPQQLTGQLAFHDQSCSAWPYFPGTAAGRAQLCPALLLPSLTHGHLEHLQLLCTFGRPHARSPLFRQSRSSRSGGDSAPAEGWQLLLSPAHTKCQQHWAVPPWPPTPRPLGPNCRETVGSEQ